MKLDKRGRQLLNLLYLDARMSFTQIGKRIRLSGLAAERRFAKLKEEGVILLMHPDVDRAKLGFSEYRLFFKFDVMDRKTEEEVIRLFESYPRTGWGVVGEGEYDVLWRIWARDEHDVENAVFLMMEKFGKKIVEKTVVTTIFEKYFTWDKAFGTERVAKQPVRLEGGKEGADGKDLKILAALYGNAREKSTAIAKKAGISPDAVNYRIKRLEKLGIINGYTAWFDARKIGFNYYKILVWFKDVSRQDEEKFVKYCMAKPDVVYMDKIMGSWDMELDVIVKDNSELHDLTRELKTKFGSIIGKHAFISVVEERMLNSLREFL